MKNLGSIARLEWLAMVAALALSGCASNTPAPVVKRDGQPVSQSQPAAAS